MNDGFFNGNFTHLQINDAMGLILLHDAARKNLDEVSSDIVISLLTRAGVDVNQARINLDLTREKLNRYFEMHPLPQPLIQSVRDYLNSH